MVEQAAERGSAQSGLNAFSFFAGVGRGLPTVVSSAWGGCFGSRALIRERGLHGEDSTMDLGVFDLFFAQCTRGSGTVRLEAAFVVVQWVALDSCGHG